MKKTSILALLGILFLTATVKAQVKVYTGTAPANNSAVSLMCTDANKGILPNQVALTSATDATTIATPPTGLLVYNTATAGSGVNVVTPGYYYWNGTRWDRFMTGPLFQSVESTGGVVANGAWQIIPGATLTANYLAGDIVTIHYSGNFGYSSGIGYAYIDIAPHVGGTILSVGGYTRAEVNSTAPWWVPYSSIAVYTIPSSGSYTFDLRTFGAITGSIAVIVGGNSSSAAETVFTITTYRK
jgi:hypothetical protein